MKMEEDTGLALAERDRFLQSYRRIIDFVRRDDEKSRTNLNLLMDELNSMEYSIHIANDEEANRLIIKLCKIVPYYEDRLLELYDPNLPVVMEYLIGAVQRCQVWAIGDIYVALAAVVYENVGRLTEYHKILFGKQGILFSVIENQTASEDVLRGATQTLENLCIRVSDQQYMDDRYAEICFEAFLKLLHRIPATKIDPNTQCKVLISALRGLQNILSATKMMPMEQLGQLLSAVRAFMYHGLTNATTVIPERLYPTPLSQYDPNPLQPIKSPFEQQPSDKEAPGSGKKSKKKKNKKAAEKKNDDSGDVEEAMVDRQTKTEHLGVKGQGQARDKSGSQNLRPAWTRISSSESEFSDTEGGQSSRLRMSCGKVRQCALACLHTLIKNTDKRLMFGYWSSFIPDSHAAANSQNVHTLFTIILKDPLPKCRMGALTALTALIEGTKTYLAVADDSEDLRTAFLPFSSVIGSTIRELHRCLLVALISENFPLTLTQLIKCMSVLVANVPYHKMRPGLLTRVMKQVRNFLYHRDPNVRVACLTCFGAVVAIQPPLMEICHIIQPMKAPSIVRQDDTMLKTDPDSGISSCNASNSDSEGSHINHEQIENKSTFSEGHSPGIMTPSGCSSGTQTPVFSDQALQAAAKEVSWIVKLCVKNVLPRQTASVDNSEEGHLHLEPLPVRLESLQLLAHLTRGYFPVIRNSLPILRDLICQCFEDKDQVVRLHTSKIQDFWIQLLSGPVPGILQKEAYNAVRATTCDCLSNMGPDVFAILPVDKRILCITLVLGLTSDEDKILRSAAIRALGVYILYPCLREDVSFVADAANSILTSMDDGSLNVRLKTAWSLANLCDALACGDNDKVKSNAVRALGNIMRYLPVRSLGKTPFRNAVENGVKALVRWNACYAVSNMFKNPLMNHGNAPWTKDILITLCSVVKDCKNFKVRINAALALGTPIERHHYGDKDLYLLVFGSLVEALQSSEDVVDFAEFRYKENLNDQICSSIIHLVTMVTSDDFEVIVPVLEKNFDLISTHLEKYCSNLLKSPTSDELPKAMDHILSTDTEDLNDLQKMALTLLKQLFIIEEKETVVGEAEKIPLQTGFRDIYD
ncbi:hypothetical protein KUTeg_010032 [Tegillarca granosa]|uniref:HEAT repeat-containing protein 6 n=1 Tax=Tegillarca granosa TaxID=220873 RepID=A0ABQ9F5Q9_TEGGR|nr:hypothetical protein KUTeg_010032 [Tegillarca granosa]